MGNRRRFSAALAGFALFVACLTGHAATLSIRLPDALLLSIVAERGEVKARVAPNATAARAEKVGIDAGLGRALRGATEIVSVGSRGFMQGDRTYLVLAAALPSVARPGGGYCGAGTEDFLFLAEWKAKLRKLELRDRLQVQSCLQPMELQSDQGNALRLVLGRIDDPARFDLVWLQHPRFGPTTKSLAVVSGRFALSP